MNSNLANHRKSTNFIFTLVDKIFGIFLCLAKEESETPEGTARTLCRRLLAQSQKADWDAVSDILKVSHTILTLLLLFYVHLEKEFIYTF
jgi:hypothetical protein